MNGIEAIEVHIPVVDDLKGSRFEDQLIEDMDVVNLAMRDNEMRGYISSEIKEDRPNEINDKNLLWDELNIRKEEEHIKEIQAQDMAVTSSTEVNDFLLMFRLGKIA
jgi:hypothetical protein